MYHRYSIVKHLKFISYPSLFICCFSEESQSLIFQHHKEVLMCLKLPKAIFKSLQSAEDRLSGLCKEYSVSEGETIC